MIDVIVTVPPHATFVSEVAAHPVVSALRLNTVMPTKGALEDVLKNLKDVAGEKDIWIDLKYRQLRLAAYAEPPFTEILLSHKIEVNTPVTAYFRNGEEHDTVLVVDGNRLIMQEGPKRVLGPGESVNIPDSSLKIYGTFTDTDKRYMEAAKRVGINNFMLSFVEAASDIAALREYVGADADIVAKIESMKGLSYVANEWAASHARLMAARGDLYIEVDRPHHILRAVKSIIDADSNAIAASRILPSLEHRADPVCQDLSDIDSLYRMGYKTLMLGDEICQKREPCISALNIIGAMNKQYDIIEYEGVE